MTEKELAALFVSMRAKFAERYPHAHVASLYIDSRKHGPGSPCTFRDLAWCYSKTGRVVLSHRAMRLERGRIMGLLAHELGHVADVRIHEKGRERRADRIAHKVLGVPIRYDERDVQNLERGRPFRPSHLHQ